MISLPRWLLVSTSLSALCLTVFASAPLRTHAQNSTQTVFPDVEPSYWAQPFIRGLALRNVITGYPDGTYRPEQTIERDEFAAIIRQAFDQEPIRQIESGSVYKDVPTNYWAANAIEQAYQQGFMAGYPGGYFRPRQEVTKVEAIVALTRGLDLTPATSTAPATTAPATIPPTATAPRRQQRAKRPFLFFPLAITSLMQPLMVPPAQAETPPTTTASTTTPQRPASVLISETYKDANQIPQYAVGSVATATQKNIVVNYPNSNVLNPNQPATRAEVAALIYQTLVAQGKVEPIAINTPTYQYIVRTDNTNQNGQ
ncbi:S-layer homology domain-containing protein [Chlorogloeopsis sp. ULAP01]|uniref:S-layer homology domain-containing protein n=1 Tax=Chlorogloeopsis sp. ULAP01 TaxID=3056483 RepID=UPI0025AA4DDC|nr:S-layer homology domain-containing protein [Chlorogloeopsis sp. ULAP01]MDM9385504.1 S-layer homology domain-containing protein [Chlorogloeopsis sp. ULAP01]